MHPLVSAEGEKRRRAERERKKEKSCAWVAEQKAS